MLISDRYKIAISEKFSWLVMRWKYSLNDEEEEVFAIYCGGRKAKKNWDKLGDIHAVECKFNVGMALPDGVDAVNGRGRENENGDAQD